MEDKVLPTLEQHFGNLTDPRMDRTKLHKLLDILVSAICAVIAGADNWEDVEEFGKARLEWLRTFLELPNGIPAHDTFTRVFARLDPEQFHAGLLHWMNAVAEVIAIAGKVLPRSHDKGIGQAAIDMVSAWASANRLVLRQVKVDEKSNEITAIPQLLEVVEVSGCIVTIDAMGCQTEIAEKIMDREAEYVLSWKENQGRLYEDPEHLFADLEDSQFQAYKFDYEQTVHMNHGRIEIRECRTISDLEVLSHLRGFANWKNITTVSRIRSQRWIGEEKSSEERYHIARITGAKRLLGTVRSLGGIENESHGTLDLASDEDRCRVPKEHGPENFALGL